MGKVMKKATVYELAAAAVFAALLSVLAPLTIPIGPIPVTLATLILYLSIYVLPTRSALSSCAVYLLLGAFGLPVFTGYAGGIAKIAGPTGGYLLGYLFLVLIGGLFMRRAPRFEKKPVNILFPVLGLLLGTAALYLFGTSIVGPVRGGVYNLFEPVVAVSASALLLGQSFHITELIGIAAILAGIAILTLSKRQ